MNTIKNKIFFMILVALVLLIPGLVRAQGPQIIIETNFEGFLAGSANPITLALKIDNLDTTNAMVDGYIGFIFPGEKLYCFDNPSDLYSIVPCGTLKDLHLIPFVSSVSIDAGQSYSTDNFFSTAPMSLASLPLNYGAYSAFAGFTRAGTLDVLSISLANFYLTDNIEIGTSLGGVQLGNSYSQLISLYNNPNSITIANSNLILSANYTDIGISFLVLDSDLSGTIEPEEKIVSIGAVSPYFGKTPGGSAINSSRPTVEAEFGTSSGSDPLVLFYPETGMRFNMDNSDLVTELFLLPPVQSSSPENITAMNTELARSLWSLMAAAGLFPSDLIDIIEHLPLK